MLLHTKRLTIRKFTEGDLDALALLLGNAEVMRFSLAGPCSREQSKWYLEKRILDHYEKFGFGLWALIYEDKLIGFAGLIMQSIDGEDLVELAYRLDPDYWGKGLANEAGGAIIEYAFHELHLNRIISIIDPDNVRSSRVATRLGMHHWKDSLYHNKTAHIYTLKQMSLDEILQAMQANMHLHMTYFAERAPSMEIVPEPDVTVVRSHIADDTFNYVLGARFTEKNAKDRIQHVTRLFTKLHLPFSWWVSELDSPTNLGDLLLQEGFVFKEKNIGMYMELTHLPPNNTPLTFRRVESPQELKTFANIIAAIGGSPGAFDLIYSKLPPATYSASSPVKMYVAYLNGAAIGTGILVTHANVSGIYYVATLPEQRHKGFGTAMMLHLLTIAKALGYHLATLQASHEGLSLYERLGFKPCCTFSEYTLPA